MPLLQTKGLSKQYRLGGKNVVHALRGIDFEINDGEIVGLVGESGSGKTTLGRCVLRLIEPSSGSVVFEGTEISNLPHRALKHFRLRAQMVFQDPAASLDPRMTIRQIVVQPLKIHRLARGRQTRAVKVEQLLEKVGLPVDCASRFPHQLSTGERQRVGIARALAVNPSLLVADEPVSALDVSIQAQIVDLLVQLQKSESLTLLFISHDLRLVHHICQRIAVMYLGRIVEHLPAGAFKTPLHPYTRLLTAAAFCLDQPEGLEQQEIQDCASRPDKKEGGDKINASDADMTDNTGALALPQGCSFRPRCPLFRLRARPLCEKQDPPLVRVGAGHYVACHEVESPGSDA